MVSRRQTRARRDGFFVGRLKPQDALTLVQEYNAERERALAKTIAKSAVREVATVAETIREASEQPRRKRRIRRIERGNDMSGSRPTGETPGQGAMTHLEKELHRDRPQAGVAEPEDAARTALRRRKETYAAIPVPQGLPQLPPSTLAERPHPGIMPRRRPVQPEAKHTDPAEAPLASPEAMDQTAVQAVPLGDAALQQLVVENLGEAYVHPQQVTPPAEPQA